MSAEQINLFENPRANHSNLGKSFEKELERTHHFYKIKHLAKIEKNSTEWRYISKGEFDRLAKTPGLRANLSQSLDGRCLQRVQSNVDFGGGALGKSIAFDAKETKGKSIPLTNFKRHQVENLVEHEKCGNCAFFLIRFSELNRVFFVKASVVRSAMDEAEFKQGRKSLSLEYCETNAKEVPVCQNLIDWLKILD